MGQALARIGGVQRHVRRARLHDRQQPDDALDRAGDAQAHQAAPFDAPVAQQRGEPVRPPVQGGVADLCRPLGDGDPVGVPAGLRGEQLVQGGRLLGLLLELPQAQTEHGLLLGAEVLELRKQFTHGGHSSR